MTRRPVATTGQDLVEIAAIAMLAYAISLALLILFFPLLVYLYVPVIASRTKPQTTIAEEAQTRFAICIPAHNEQSVIGQTVETLNRIDYPPELYDIHVVADHCDDRTAAIARSAGATAHEREDGPRGSKGAALTWLFARILSVDGANPPYDAVIVFDADTQVDGCFLRIMDARLSKGDQVVQGQHRISNPRDGWFPALTSAMFLIDNRYQNLGRANLGWSAKNMGDSICLCAGILRRRGWAEGLTEDYALRQQLMLDGVRIRYEPDAIGNGEAAQNWRIARSQRMRWLRGTYDSSRRYARQLLSEGVRRRDMALIDGGLQAYLPSYSTLTMMALIIWLANFVLWTGGASVLIGLWTIAVALLVVYPLFGLMFERAPAIAYLAILSGPMYIVWRTWLAFVSRWRSREVRWIRTPRKEA